MANGNDNQPPPIPGLTPEQTIDRLRAITQGAGQGPMPAYKPEQPAPPQIPGLTPGIAMRPETDRDRMISAVQGGGQAMPRSVLGDRIAPGESIPEHEMVPAYQAANPNLSEHEAGKLAYQELRPKITSPYGTPPYYNQRIQQIEFDKAHPWGGPISAHPGTMGKIGHILGTIGNIAGDILAPQTMALIPQTQLGREFEEAGLGAQEAGAERRGIQEQELQARSQEAQARAAETELQRQKLAAGELLPADEGYFVRKPDGSVTQLLDDKGNAIMPGDKNWQTEAYHSLIAQGHSAEDASNIVGGAGKARKEGEVKYDAGIPVEIFDRDGTSYAIDPSNLTNIPPQLRDKAQIALAAHREHQTEAEQRAADQNALTLDRELKMFDARQDAPTAQERMAQDRAVVAAQAIPGIITEIKSHEKELGPVLGRWNDYMQGKVGLKGDLAGLRTDLKMLANAVAMAHAVGRLPENLREDFEQMIYAPQQDPENLVVTLQHTLPWMQNMAQVSRIGRRQSPGVPTGAPAAPAAQPGTATQGPSQPAQYRRDPNDPNNLQRSLDGGRSWQ